MYLCPVSTKMGLILKYRFCQQCSCKTALFSDTTGTGANGYGSPNLESAAVTQAKITITPPNYTQSIVFDFTILSGTVTSCIRTDIFGNTTNITGSSPPIVFPFVNMEFDSKLIFGDAVQNPLADGNWNVVYWITDGSHVFSNQSSNIFICHATQCKQEVTVKYSKGLVNKQTAIDTFLAYNSLLNAIEMKNLSDINERLETMASICSTCKIC